jgi:glycosyltransferase involved in cell wall biosynthesis
VNLGRRGLAWLDVTDILDWIKSNESVTGIQRVVAQLIIELASFDFGSQSGSENSSSIGSAQRRIGGIVLCHYDLDRREYVVDPQDDFVSLLKEFMLSSREPQLRRRRSLWPRLRKTLVSLIPKPIRPARFQGGPVAAGLVSQGPPAAVLDRCRFHCGDVFVLMGAFWFRPFNVNVILSHCRAYNMRLAVLLQDIIPIRCAAWFPPGHAAAWTMDVGLVLHAADTVLTPSHHSARDIRAFCLQSEIAEPAITILRYGATTARFVRGPVRTKRVERYLSTGFVLMVSSIDYRKNQHFLIRVWQRLHAKYANATPYLVLIGKPAIRADEILLALRNCGPVRRRIVVLGDVDDAELAAFYTGALFTVFPSLAEGWGLPVAESLRHGKVCIASSAWSIPEVAGDLVDYCEPDDLDGYCALIERYCFDHHARRDREQRIRAEYVPVDWAQTACELITSLQPLFSENGSQDSRPRDHG